MEKQNLFLRFYGGCLVAEFAALIAVVLWTPELSPPQPPTTVQIGVAAGLGFGVSLMLVRYALPKRFKRRAEEDERSRDIARRSAWIAYVIVSSQLFFAGALIGFMDEEPFGWGYYVSTTLFAVAVLMVMVYCISYLIINRGMQKNG